ncbi:hypothetical protein [Flavobacterium limi]|uniref:YD repeat-containing protein n=1 Tax=Flavobacterium limi TaxID=2045105 RepID=A0ABQ1V0F3_9FLAO|nr:hypothetical protein [Flavobacterium limi]GGF30331.1 hypothetical protein GCM10011518_44470 [Flavobacterium limi]
MNKHLFFVFVFTILFLPLKILSQEIANPYTSTENTIKSPQVHLLKEFANHPVDLSSGLVDVSIPLYEINFGDIKIPLNLKFHASGLKADITENGILGLKWVTNIGGFISREVRGYPDEKNDHKQGINNLAYTPDWITLFGGTNDNRPFSGNNVIFTNQDLSQFSMPGIYGKYEDTEYDIFTFLLPNGKSGKFILKDINGNKTASFMPYQPYKIKIISEYLYSSVYHTTTTIELTDDLGFIYKFGKNDLNKPYYETDQEYYSVNCWLLNSITSPNAKDIIKFEYINTLVNGNSTLPPVIIHDQLTTSPNYFSNDMNICSNSVLYDLIGNDLHYNHFVKNYNSPPGRNQEACILTKITYNDLSINFNYLQNVPDLNGFLLNNIEIKNNAEILKKIEFDITSPGRESLSELEKPSYLNFLQIKDKNNQVIEKYKFEYYNLDNLPNGNKLVNSADYWGYYNSQVQNVISQETVNIAFTSPVGACANGGSITQYYNSEIGASGSRFSNSEDMKIGMLKTITYPTGGQTEFEYESNKIMSTVGNPTDCGGLRIKTVIEKDKNGAEIKKKEYKYGLNEDGGGQIPNYLYPDPNTKNEIEETATDWKVIDNFMYMGNHGPLGFRNQSANVTYITRVFSGYFPSRYYTFLNKLIYYNKVTEYIGDSSNNIGKIENYYSNNIPQIQDYNFNTSNFTYKNNKFAVDPSNFWSGNNLNQKIEYKKANNNTYIKVRETNYSYQDYIVDEIFDTSIFKYKTFYGLEANQDQDRLKSNSNTIAKQELERIINSPESFFGYKTQKYTIGVENLAETTEKLYLTNNDSIVQTTINEYDLNKPTFLRERTTINSKGESITQKFSYPFNSNTGVYSQMATANVISPVVENITLNNNKVTGSALLTYKKSDDNFVPDKNYIAQLNSTVPFANFTAFDGSTKDSRYGADPENTYDAYDDHGNPIQITSKGKATTVYVWGYQKDYPIAKIENATYTAGQPNTITAAQQALINTAIAATINETTSVTETILREKLQLVRAGFPDAMVSTFTYDPLIGITSMTDPKDYTTYYEYDSYGRLKQVRDKESKVLSANKYNYKNQ